MPVPRELAGVNDLFDLTRAVQAWLAEPAGTTVNTVRHYHRLGLLPEPDRHVNNYWQCGAGALVRCCASGVWWSSACHCRRSRR